MILGFLNKRGWNEEKGRTLVEEGKENEVIGEGETGWHNNMQCGKLKKGGNREEGGEGGMEEGVEVNPFRWPFSIPEGGVKANGEP